MKFFLSQVFGIYTISVVAISPQQWQQRQQHALVGADMTVTHNDRVPGHSDATYSVVPVDDQLFEVEFLEVAPTPIRADRVFFAYLRGNIPEHKKDRFDNSPDRLDKATIKVSSSVVYAEGDREDHEPIFVPLKTITLNDAAQLVVRDERGSQVDYMPSKGYSALLLNFQLPSLFIRSGTWTFNVDARIGDEADTCLFAMSVTQWLEGQG